MPRVSNKRRVVRAVGQRLLTDFYNRRSNPEPLNEGSDGDDDSSSISSSSASSESLSFSSSSMSSDSTAGARSLSSLSASSTNDLLILDSASFLGQDEDSAEEEFDFIRHVLQRLESTRVLLERRTPRGMERLVDRLNRLRQSSSQGDHDFFRHLVRVHPDAFDEIARLISSHPQFSARDARRPGASAAEQLAVALYRFGRHGNGGGVVDVAFVCGCSEGSVVNYTKRVAAALYDMRAQVLCWASEDERHAAQAWVAGRTGCDEMARGWSMLDGSLLPLAFKPGKHAHHREYYDRKGQYSLNLQLVVLPTTLRIIEFVAGYKGTTQDSRAVSASDVVKNPRLYLEEGEFIWVDGGYALSDYTCGPYDHVVAQKSRDFRVFNYVVSSIRVRSEHAFAYLKGRFPSLRGLRWLLRDTEDHTIVTRIVVAMLVAHNLALRKDGAAERQVFFDLSGVPTSSASIQVWKEMQQRTPAQDEMERMAWDRRHRTHVQQRRADEQRNQGRSQAEIDTARRTDARVLREEVHAALFESMDRPFEDTIPESRQVDKTAKEWWIAKQKKEKREQKKKEKRQRQQEERRRQAWLRAQARLRASGA